MIVNVIRVSIPAWSTIGYGWGKTEDGRLVQFARDHRPMRCLGEALENAHLADEADIAAEIKPYQIVKEYTDK